MVNLIVLSFIVPSLISTFTGFRFWPFSDFSMFSFPIKKDGHTSLRLTVFNARGEERFITNTHARILKPVGPNGLNIYFKNVFESDHPKENMRKVLKHFLNTYNKHESDAGKIFGKAVTIELRKIIKNLDDFYREVPGSITYSVLGKYTDEKANSKIQ